MTAKSRWSKAAALILVTALLLLTPISCANPGGGDASNVSGSTDTPIVPALSAEELAMKEAPALTALVDAGKLPPVEERLPENPYVVQPYEGLGKYGGMWRQSVTIGVKHHAMHTIGYYSGMNLVTWNMDLTEIEGNLAESFSFDETYTVLTVTLRKGLRWSDGYPMTTEDVLFWWESLATNQTVSPGSTEWIGVKMDIADELTFTMTFPEARPFYLTAMAERGGSYWFAPKHYLSQFHADYTSKEEATKTARNLGFDGWVKCFLDRRDHQTNAELPTMTPWLLVTDGAAASQLVFERNPYYWAVDSAGRQLPYIDSCVVNIVQSNDIMKMKAISGEFEMAYAGIVEDFSDFPLYAEYAEEFGYELRTSEFDEPGALNIHINITNKDAEKRRFIEQVKFRQAMSLALNREEIVDLFYTVGAFRATVRNNSPYTGSPYYSEEMSNRFTDYDPDRANALLDALGLDKKNSDGMRLLPSGAVFSLIIDAPTHSSQWLDVAVHIANYWKQVGINASARSVDPSLWDTRCRANDFDVSVHTGSGGVPVVSNLTINDLTGYSFYSWPHRFNSGNYLWRGGSGSNGVEPLPEIKRLWELGGLVVHEVDEAKRDKMMREILQIHNDNLYILGICTRMPAVYLVKSYMKNVPPLDPSWSYGYTGHGRPEQYWLDQ